MSDLNAAKGLIARGERESAIGLLASILLTNRDECEAWQLLGDLIDDPSRKKVCYKQVLRLSPQHPYALTRLQELEKPPPAGPQITSSPDATAESRAPTKEIRKRPNYVPNWSSYPPAKRSRAGLEVISYVIAGIAGFLIILYAVGRADGAANDSNTLYIGLIFLSLIAAIIILSASNKNRD